MSKIKICGLTRLQDIEYVNEARPDYIGFVFAESRRQVGYETAARLRKKLSGRIKAVGVFVNEEQPSILQLCENGVIDLIQLHGDEDNQYILALKSKLAIRGITSPVIKAARVRDAGQTVMARQFDSDFILLDTYSDKAYGGTGKAFDWQLCKNAGRPFFLAGGINCGNAAEAIKTAKPYCLDVSSGVENGGFKDREKIIELVKLVRSVK